MAAIWQRVWLLNDLKHKNRKITIKWYIQGWSQVWHQSAETRVSDEHDDCTLSLCLTIVGDKQNIHYTLHFCNGGYCNCSDLASAYTWPVNPLIVIQPNWTLENSLSQFKAKYKREPKLHVKKLCDGIKAIQVHEGCKTYWQNVDIFI